MYLDKAKKEEIFSKYGKSNSDTGSAESQIALFSYRIAHLTEHVDPFMAIEKYGTDPIRWYMISNSSPWDNLKFDEAGVEEVSGSKFFGKLHNTYSFFALYANLCDFDFAAPQVPLAERPEIDRWIISVLNSLVKEVTDDIEDYESTKLTDNGKLTEYLENLEYCGFIRKYNCIGMKAKNALFQLMDNYTLFYYKFIKDSYINDAQYWTKITGKPEYNTWCGLAFERVCLQHVEQIKAKLGIQGVITTVYSWSVTGSKEKPGAQIDLLIDRNDDVINLCEIKYSKAPFQITNTIDASLQNKRERFIQETGTEKAVHLTMITTMGLSDNPYAWDVQSVVTMDDLFVLW